MRPERHIASFAELPSLFADGGQLPLAVGVEKPALVVLASLRQSGLLEVTLQHPRSLPVTVSKRAPWGQESGLCFWNYSAWGALRGRKNLNTGVFTGTLGEGGLLTAPPTATANGYCGVQGITLEDSTLSYRLLLLGMGGGAAPLAAFLNHLGLGDEKPLYFDSPQRAYTAWRAKHENKE
jgi:hypothetical protein